MNINRNLRAAVVALMAAYGEEEPQENETLNGFGMAPRKVIHQTHLTHGRTDGRTDTGAPKNACEIALRGPEVTGGDRAQLTSSGTVRTLERTQVILPDHDRR